MLTSPFPSVWETLTSFCCSQRRDGLVSKLISQSAMSRVHWQAESHFAPTCGMILDGNGATLSLDQQFAGIETKTGGFAHLLARSHLTMIELLEDVWQVGRRDPAAGVAQHEEEPVRLLRAVETDLAVSRSSTQRILEEIIQHLLKTMQVQ